MGQTENDSSVSVHLCFWDSISEVLFAILTSDQIWTIKGDYRWKKGNQTKWLFMPTHACHNTCDSVLHWVEYEMY